MPLKSYLKHAGGQILSKKAEPNYQRIADDWFYNFQIISNFILKIILKIYLKSNFEILFNRGTLISLAAFVDSIHANNEKERWQNAPSPDSNAHLERL